jgi:hypothetical protein
MKWYVFDLTNVSFRLLMRMSRIHLLNATQRLLKNACRWQICCSSQQKTAALAVLVLSFDSFWGDSGATFVLLVSPSLPPPSAIGMSAGALVFWFFFCF